MSEPFDPAAALALARSTRAGLADRTLIPAWYAPLYGLGCGTMIAAHALPRPYGWLGFVAALGAILLMYRYWANTAGVSVNGFRAGRTLPLTIVFTVVVFTLGGGAIVARYEHGLVWAPLAAGAIIAVVAAAASHRWDRLWIAEMRDRP